MCLYFSFTAVLLSVLSTVSFELFFRLKRCVCNFIESILKGIACSPTSLASCSDLGIEANFRYKWNNIREIKEKKTLFYICTTTRR